MTASEKLAQLIENDKLTNEQLDNLSDLGICEVRNLKDYLVNKIEEMQPETDTIVELASLIDYNDNEYIVYDGHGVHKLDFDMLNDILEIG